MKFFIFLYPLSSRPKSEAFMPKKETGSLKIKNAVKAERKLVFLYPVSSLALKIIEYKNGELFEIKKYPA